MTEGSMQEQMLAAWRWEGAPTLVADTGGLINQTWRVDVDGATAAVLQRLNTAIFRPEVHHDIDGITAWLDAKGLLTPRLVPTTEGRLWAEGPDGSVWRCLTPVGSRTVHKLATAAEASSAGRLVARFHAATWDLDWHFHSIRPGIHDTPRHMAALKASLQDRRGHRLYDDVQDLALDVLERWQAWKGPRDLPRRIVHGDLKISNLRYEGDEAVALIDLDTLQHGTLDAELGDALRSWCNRATEDEPARLDLDLLEGALWGYVDGWGDRPGPDPEEWAAIVPGLERICLELAARFARDALEESYFGWDPSRYATRGEHCLIRARGQASLAAAVGRAAPAAQDRLDRLLRGR